MDNIQKAIINNARINEKENASIRANIKANYDENAGEHTELSERIDGVDTRVDEVDQAIQDIELLEPEKGEKGDVGSTGAKGDKGDKGDRGSDGFDGIDGASGLDGKDGKDGLDGTTGAVGEQGEKGDRPGHEWKGTALRFERVDGSWGSFTDLQGDSAFGGGGGISRHSELSGLTIGDEHPQYLLLEGRGGQTIDDSLTINNGIHLGAGTTSVAPLKFTSGDLLATPEAGAIEYDGHFHVTNASGQQRGLVTNTGIVTSTTTVVNTTTETQIYTHTFNANELFAGERINFDMSGVFSNASAADDFTIRLKIGGTTIHTLTRAGGLQTNAGWKVNYNGTIRTAGASGTFFDIASYQGNRLAPIMVSDVAGHSIDTTASVVFSVTVQWANAKAGNTFSLTQGDLTFKH